MNCLPLLLLKKLESAPPYFAAHDLIGNPRPEFQVRGGKENGRGACELRHGRVEDGSVVTG
jgi:hypothetical protein